MIIHTGHPVVLHGGLLVFGVLSSVALDLDDEMQEVMAAVDDNDKVWSVHPHFGGVAVGDLEAEVVILDVGLDPGMGFDHAAELPLPVAVEDDPIDVATAGIRLVEIGLGGGEVDVGGGTDGIVGIEHGFDRATADLRSRDGGRDALAGDIGQLLVHELGGVGATLADEAAIEPLSGDALELSEEIELRLFVRVAPLRVEQLPGEMEEEL